MEQMITTLSARSRITSSSYSFQPEEGLLNQNLGDGAGVQPGAGDGFKFFLVVGNAATGTARQEVGYKPGE